MRKPGIRGIPEKVTFSRIVPRENGVEGRENPGFAVFWSIFALEGLLEVDSWPENPGFAVFWSIFALEGLPEGIPGQI